MSSEFFVSPLGNDRWSGLLAEPNTEGTDGPFATIGRAQKAARKFKKKGQMSAPVRVVLRGGFYSLKEPLTFTPEDSGSPAPKGEWNRVTGPERSVTYAAYPGESPVLSGGQRITGWKAAEVNGHTAWVAHIPEVKRGKWFFTQLWVNGKRARRSRLPKQGLYQIAEPLGQLVFEGDPTKVLFIGQDQFRYNGEDIQYWRNVKDVEMVALHYWIESRIPFEDVDTDQHIARLQWKSRMRLTDDFSKGGAPYYVENVYEAVEEPGQFYLDRQSGDLFYLPRPGEKMDTAEVIAPRLPQLMHLQGDMKAGTSVANIVFEGVTFSHSEWVPGEERFTATPQAACHVPGAIVLHHAHDCRFINCAITHVGSYGIEIADGSHDIEVSHCNITDLGAGGVKVWHTFSGEPLGGGAGPDFYITANCNRVIIADNEIGDGGYRYHQAVGVLIGKCTGVQLVHNNIHDLDYSGVSVGWTWGYQEGFAYGNIIEYNHIYNIGRGKLSDMGGIYTLGVQPGTRLRYNLIHDVQSRGYGGWGIYNDEGSSHILIENNLVYRTKSNGYNQHYGENNLIRNNIFAFGKEAQFSRGRVEPHNSFTFTQNLLYFDNDGTVLAGNWTELNATVDRNLYFNVSGKPLKFAGQTFKQWQKRGADKHSVMADPLFADPAHGNFTLQSGSPAEQIGFTPFDLSTVGPRKG
jgi:hypothetical protein